MSKNSPHIDMRIKYTKCTEMNTYLRTKYSEYILTTYDGLPLVSKCIKVSCLPQSTYLGTSQPPAATSSKLITILRAMYNGHCVTGQN